MLCPFGALFRTCLIRERSDGPCDCAVETSIEDLEFKRIKRSALIRAPSRNPLADESEIMNKTRQIDSLLFAELPVMFCHPFGAFVFCFKLFTTPERSNRPVDKGWKVAQRLL